MHALGVYYPHHAPGLQTENLVILLAPISEFHEYVLCPRLCMCQFVVTSVAVVLPGKTWTDNTTPARSTLLGLVPPNSDDACMLYWCAQR